MKKNNYFSNLFFALLLLATESSIFSQMKSVHVTFVHADILQSQCKAIVNDANEQLLYDLDSTCKIIFDAAGVDLLQAACNAFPYLQGDIRCFVGNTCITDSFDLNNYGIEKIIHAVSPDCRKITPIEEQDHLLQKVYQNILHIADQNKISSIALPFISADDHHGFPKKRCCEIALKTIKEYLKNNPNTNIELIKFVLSSKEDFHLFCKTWKQIIL